MDSVASGMTSFEVGILMTLATLAAGMISYLFKRQLNTYTKTESDDRMDSKLVPLVAELAQGKEARQENTQEMKSLNESITTLRVELAKHQNV